ncbi:Ig-like domain-containing protein [Methylobacterium sp. Leaf85]|uniref:Ig-like domain-containing protein n=1 Tax=Methylobacterium sp. Leaf85 TaxID=1736241 RepID=UPI0006FE7A3D|nr:Ig-like domain-containing protein [Methylobacterium sp. Leaf85]KQO51614.1 hypothetical protein ASF08_22090 [Methylobacterium sp. Leaf85]
MASVVSIVAAEPLLNATSNTTEVTFTFSEAVTGFDLDEDVTISGGVGSLSSLGTSDGGITWTAVFTPSLVFEGSTTLSVTGP